MKPSQPTPEDACRKLLAPKGVKARLASELGLTRGAISQWRRVPAERLEDVARVTGIPAATLRPDLAAAFGTAA